MEVPLTPLLIDGEERLASNNATFEVRQPHTEHLVGRAASASSKDCQDAIDAASRAFKSWETSHPLTRRNIFHKVAELSRSERWYNLLCQAQQTEIAMSREWSHMGCMGIYGNLFIQAGYVDQLRAETFPSDTGSDAQVIIQRRAKGVLLAIVPWNAPVVLTLRAIAIPILCGNTVVLKGSELTPRSHYLVAKLFHEAGLPAGVLNCISISQAETASLVLEMIANPHIRHVNFTGSTRVGRLIVIEAAKHLKPCVLELGGKAPTIVLAQADLGEAAKAIVSGALLNSGQICMSTERVIVQSTIANALMFAIRDICKGIKAGDLNLDETIKLGPLYSTASAIRLVEALKDTQKAGAEVILGDLDRDNNVIQPHLLTGVKPGMRLWDEESFGPVIVFAIFETIDEAVNLANASEFSLTSSVWSEDLTVARQIATRIRYGTVIVNGFTIHTEPSAGLMGLGGASGYGRFDVEHFTDKRTVVCHTAKGRKYPIVSD